MSEATDVTVTPEEARPLAELSRDSESADLAAAAAELAADRKATDISVLQMADGSSVTDYFVIASGRSDIQVKAICERIAEGLRERGATPLSTEGVEHGQWGLLDYGDIVVHVFQEQVRTVYDLERLWNGAPRWTYRPDPAIGDARDD